MIKLIVVCVISSVVSIGVYERYVLGLDRSEQNDESAAVLVLKESISTRTQSPSHQTRKSLKTFSTQQDIRLKCSFIHSRIKNSLIVQGHTDDKIIINIADCSRPDWLP